MEIVPSIMHSYLIKSTIFNYFFIGLLIIAVIVVFLTIVYHRRVKKEICDDTVTVLRVYICGTMFWTLCLVGARSISDNYFDRYSYGFLIDGDLKTVSEINEKELLSSEQLFDLGYVFNRLENYGYSNCAEVKQILYIKKSTYLKKVNSADLHYAISHIYPNYKEL